eukprot:3977326-Pyramimonas_sp.AAC.1
MVQECPNRQSRCPRERQTVLQEGPSEPPERLPRAPQDCPQGGVKAAQESPRAPQDTPRQFRM